MFSPGGVGLWHPAAVGLPLPSLSAGIPVGDSTTHSLPRGGFCVSHCLEVDSHSGTVQTNMLCASLYCQHRFDFCLMVECTKQKWFCEYFLCVCKFATVSRELIFFLFVVLTKHKWCCETNIVCVRVCHCQHIFNFSVCVCLWN